MNRKIAEDKLNIVDQLITKKNYYDQRKSGEKIEATDRDLVVIEQDAGLYKKKLVAEKLKGKFFGAMIGLKIGRQESKISGNIRQLTKYNQELEALNGLVKDREQQLLDAQLSIDEQIINIEKLKKELVDVSSKIDSSSSELNLKRKVIKTNKKSEQDLSESIGSLKVKYESILGDIGAVQQSLNWQVSFLRDKKAEKDSISKNIEEINLKIDKFKEAISKSKTDALNVESEIKNLTLDLGAHKELLNVVSVELQEKDSEYKSLDQIRSSILTDINSLVEEHKIILGRISDVHKQTKECDGNINKLDLERKEILYKMKNSEQEHDEVKTNLVMLEEMLVEKRYILDGKRKKLSSIITSVSQLQERCTQADIKIKQCDTEFERVDDLKNSALNEQRENSVKLTVLNEQLAKQQSEIDSKFADVNKLVMDVDVLKALIGEKETALGNYRMELDSAESEHANLLGEKQQLKSELSEKVEELDNVRALIAGSAKEKERLMVELEGLNLKNSKIKNEIEGRIKSKDELNAVIFGKKGEVSLLEEESSTLIARSRELLDSLDKESKRLTLLEQEKGDIFARIKILKSSIVDTKTSIGLKAQGVADINIAIAAYQNEIVKLDESLSLASLELNDRSLQLSTSMLKHDELLEVKSDLGRKIQATFVEINKINDQLEESNKRKTIILNDIATYEKNAKKASDDLKSKKEMFLSHDEKYQYQQQELGLLVKKCTELRADNADFDRRIGLACDNILQIESEKDNATHELQKALKGLEQRKYKMVELEAEQENLKQLIRDISGKKIEADRSLLVASEEVRLVAVSRDSVNVEYLSSLENLSAVEEESKMLASNLDLINNEISLKQKHLGSVRTEIRKLSKENLNKLQAKEDLEIDHIQLINQISVLETDLSIQKEKGNKLHMQVTQVKKEVDDKQLALETLQGAVDASKVLLDEKIFELATLDKMLPSLSKKLNSEKGKSDDQYLKIVQDMSCHYRNIVVNISNKKAQRLFVKESRRLMEFINFLLDYTDVVTSIGISANGNSALTVNYIANFNQSTDFPKDEAINLIKSFKGGAAWESAKMSVGDKVMSGSISIYEIPSHLEVAPF